MIYDGSGGMYERTSVRSSVLQGWQCAMCSNQRSSNERVRVPNSIRIRYGGQPTRSGFGYERDRSSSNAFSGGRCCSFSNNARFADPGGRVDTLSLIQHRILSMALA